MTYGIGLRTRALSLAADHEEAGRNQTADVLQQLADENDTLREALRRLHSWGGVGCTNYSATVAFGVTDWFKAGAIGPLPELPDYARHEPPNAKAQAGP